MPSLGPLEVLIILIVAVLVFPPHKLPDVARQAGRALGALRRFQSTITADFERLLEEDERDETPKLPPKTDGVGPSTRERSGSTGDRSVREHDEPADRGSSSEAAPDDIGAPRAGPDERSTGSPPDAPT